MYFWLLASIIFLVVYMYLVRHFNAQNFCKALDEEVDGGGSIFSGVKYRGQYAGSSFIYNKYGKATYLYIETDHQDAKKDLGYMAIPYGWKSVATNITYHQGKFFYSSFDKGGFNFFLYLYSPEEFKAIFDKLINAAKAH